MLHIETAGGGGRQIKDRQTRKRYYDRAAAEKNTLKPHLRQQWVIPPDASAAFVAAMEDILEVYQRPYNPKRPLVCVDETSKQLIAETRLPIAPQPPQPPPPNSHNRRNRTPNL